MMVFRVAVAFVFLGVTVWFQMRLGQSAQPNFYPLYSVVSAIGVLTILYALSLAWVANLKFFTFIQVTVDVFLVTVIVFVTGGIESYLPMLYTLAVIGGAILLGMRGGFYAASLASMAFGAVILLDFYELLPEWYKVLWSPAQPSWGNVATTYTTNVIAYFTVAYLSGYLAESTARVERELVEKEIDYERLEALNRRIVENITSGIMTLDEQGRITSFNNAAVAATGLELRAVYYRHVSEVFPGLLSGEDGAPIVSGRTEKTFCLGDGVERYLGFNISPGPGDEVSKIIIFQDLTKLKALEEQLRRADRLKALGELSAAIAHEIRNPLASISGSIQVLREELDLTSDDAHLMEIVLRETERLNSLITDFLLFARPVHCRKEEVDICEVVGETIDVFRNSPDARHIDIRSSVCRNLRVRGDTRQISQVFWNLLVNAAQAVEGEGVVEVSARAVTAGGREAAVAAGDGRAPSGFVEISIRDTGRGMSAETAESIFDPFFSTKDGGTGLGLAIVHRIVESHGGTIDVASTPGEGTEFKVRFPLVEEYVSSSVA